MRLFAAFAVIAALGACEREIPAPPPEIARTAPAPWFICDSIDAPRILVFEREGARVRVAAYSKADGALVSRGEYIAGDAEGAAGSITTPLRRDGVEAGAIIRTNTQVLENPAAAFTPRFASVRLEGEATTCRWLPRTLAQGFTSRLSFVVHQDEDGDLIYSAYDFTDAASAPRITLSDNGETSVVSREIRDGATAGGPDGERFLFESGALRAAIVLGADGAGTIETATPGGAPESAPLIAFTLLGAGPD